MAAVLAAPVVSDAGQFGRGARGRGQHRGWYEVPGRGRAGRIQDPASASGYDAGYEKGLADGRDGHRYDPVRHRDYRDGERGYRGEYGSRDAYRINFRAGFRQGYEDGYRDGARYRR